MDFLDPRKRQAHRIRLMIGYVLVGIAILLGTIILVYGTNGFGINPKTGQIIQNGLLFVDSKPGAAEIWLNNQDKNAATAARLTLPAGDYQITLKKNGYRSWQRSFTLEPSSVARYVYPFLFPTNPRVTVMTNYKTTPPLVTISPDQRWLLVQEPDKAATFDIYDATNLTKAPQSVDVPAGILSTSNDPVEQFSLVEWSTDNNNLLLRHSYTGGTEYVVFDHAKPDSSFNVNQTFKTNPDQVALYNKKVAQLYIYSQADQTLSLGDVSKGTLNEVVLKDVLAFKPNGTNLITYVTAKSMPPGEVQARIWSSGQTFPLYSFKAGSTYLIDAAQYSGHWYYAAGSDNEGKVNIYEDPLSNIQNTSLNHAIPTIALYVDGANKLSFSANARFIEIENGQSFGVYDIETQDRYQYKLTSSLVAPLVWMDGHRLLGEVAGKVFVTDYDSTNQQSLVATADSQGGLFSGNFNHMFTLQTKSDGTVDLVNVDMRAGTDLPQNPQAQ